MARCIGFDMEIVEDAYQHMEYEIIHDYGDYAYGHYLHTWDDGKRILGKCKKCGGYILIQKSEYHSFSGDDSIYIDYFPVDSEIEADELNKKYSGFDIEEEFHGRYIAGNGYHFSWKKGK